MQRKTTYRIRRSEILRRLQEECNNLTIYILREYGPTSFLLQDIHQNKYKVRFFV